ncbi:hypothetical protein D0T23_30135 [Duganella sp. BJB475]|nr:hypothetical protein D0T23_30135 [Duganella sp. BJB475]RFP36225.1 hypothetical protein D0T21_07275 [Duganella sp. BJB476]
MAERVDRISIDNFRLAEDRQRNAFMFRTGALSRDTGMLNHYLLYFMRHWFDIRSSGRDIFEVSFYDFPPNLEMDRKWIQQCFGQAARIYGWDGHGGDTLIFDPIFREDDWYLG